MNKNINLFLISLFVLGAVILGIALFGCGSGTTTDTTASGTIDGAALYSTDCSGCHGALATSGKKGASLSQIQTAISHNMGGMGAFANLTAEELQAIMTVLSAAGAAAGPEGTTSPASTTSIDGAALYTDNCASCHGPLATSSKAGAAMSMIQNAIANNRGGMSKFSTLSTAQLQAIADALAAKPASGSTSNSLDGVALYAINCSSCHGALASSSKRGATASQILTGISSVSAMSSLSNLTIAQVQAIATALGTTATSTSNSLDGVALYSSNCSSCHGALASSSKRGATASEIQTGISSVGAMRSLSNLTSAQIQAIATALGSTGTSTPAPTGCGSCHAIPPATGHHALHVGEVGLSCGVCHGTGYSPTTVNAATHDNGVINIASTPGYNPTTGTCSNACHGTHTW